MFLKRRQISPLLPIEGIMTTLESVKNHSSPTRLPPSAKEPLRVSEAEYWKTYYEYPDRSYEWNNGLLEEKTKRRPPMSDFLSISLYRWFSRLLEEYLTVFPIGQIMILEMGFRLELGKQKVSIRKPDLAVILHSNPVEAKPLDRSFRGVCDLCIEFFIRLDSRRGGTGYGPQKRRIRQSRCGGILYFRSFAQPHRLLFSESAGGL